MGHFTYKRADGVQGVGFKIEYSGVVQHSVAWPDRPAERYKDDELARHHIVTFKGKSPVDEDRESSETSGEDDGAPVAPMTEAEAIRMYLTDNPDAANAEVIETLAHQGFAVTSSQVSRQRKKLKQ